MVWLWGEPLHFTIAILRLPLPFPSLRLHKSFQMLIYIEDRNEGGNVQAQTLVVDPFSDR